MKSAFFIMKIWKTGNIGSHNISKLEDNPKDGYSNYNEAKHQLSNLLENNNWLKKSGYSFSIMELFY